MPRQRCHTLCWLVLIGGPPQPLGLPPSIPGKAVRREVGCANPELTFNILIQLCINSQFILIKAHKDSGGVADLQNPEGLPLYRRYSHPFKLDTPGFLQ